MTLFAKAVGAVMSAEIDLDGATLKPKDAHELVRAALMAMQSELQDMRVHTDGYQWTRRRSGPFLVWDEIEEILNSGGEPRT